MVHLHLKSFNAPFHYLIDLKIQLIIIILLLFNGSMMDFITLQHIIFYIDNLTTCKISTFECLELLIL